MRRSRAAAAVAVTVSVLAALAGCSEIPTSGPVIGGDPVDPPPGQQRPFIRQDAPPPLPGDSPVGIVDGFVEAMASYAPGYETAREYLTEDAGASWDTSAGITVFLEAKPAIEAISENLVGLRMVVSGEVDRDGTYVAAAPGDTQELQLRMEQEDGEWRIANPPDGIMLAGFSFDQEYEPYNVYFFDPQLSVLVPDPVYLPRSANAATLLAQTLLAGPSSWLAPAVRTAFPEGTELALDAVPVVSGTATVELSEAAGLASPEERERMLAQLTWTLGMLSEVDRVEVTSGEIPLWQGGEPASQHDSAMNAFNPTVVSADAPLYAVTADGVVSLADGGFVPVPGPLGSMPGIGEVAVNVGGNRAVVVTGGGTALQAAMFGEGEAVQPLLDGVDLRSPAWDRTGLIWAVDRGANGPGFVVARPDGERLQVVVPELQHRDVERLAVSLDGTRIAVVVGEQAFVGDIVRDAERPTVRIEQLRRLGPMGRAVDIAWHGIDSVAILLQGSTDEQPVPYVVGLSGRSVAPRGAAVADAVRVGAAPGHSLVVQAADGTLFEQRSGNSWSDIGAAISPTYPG